MKKQLLAVLATAVLGMAGTSVSAAPVNPFTVNEGSVPGALDRIITADLINGAYKEMISFSAPDATGTSTFVTNAIANFSQFTIDGNSPVASQLGVETELFPQQYGLYAIFTSSGTGNLATQSFTGTSGFVSLYIDPNIDTVNTLGADGASPVTSINTSDDYLLATADDLTRGVGSFIAGTGGFFDLILDNFQLTAAGEEYFTSPRPFYLRVNVDGDFNQILAEGNQQVNGDLSAVFLVPEPGSLALVGLALFGLGAARRRKSVK